MNNNRRPAFNCVLIDEAGQCTEPDMLVPLQYGTSKLILVGDQNQLPATVLSQKASRYNFGQSLFERIIHALGQYREKCSDPSRGLCYCEMNFCVNKYNQYNLSMYTDSPFFSKQFVTSLCTFSAN